MNELKVFQFGNEGVVDSREVAEMTGKDHAHLMRDIGGYVQVIEKSTESKFGLSDINRHADKKDRMREYFVYVHTNLSNGKKYIGITKNDVLRRWRNGKAYEHCKRFNAAIKEFGWDGFSHEVVASGVTLECARLMEVALIEKYQSCNEQYGYNMSPGGGRISEDQKLLLSTARKGRWNPFFGKQHSEDFKKNVSKWAKTMCGNKSSQARPVICVNTGELFSCMVDAAKKYGIKCPSDISKVCRGVSKSRGKYYDGSPLIWKYAPCEKPHKHHGITKSGRGITAVMDRKSVG